ALRPQRGNIPRRQAGHHGSLAGDGPEQYRLSAQGRAGHLLCSQPEPVARSLYPHQDDWRRSRRQGRVLATYASALRRRGSMRRRDLSMALIASSMGASLLDQHALAQSGVALPQTEAEREAGVMPANLGYPSGNVQRYGARGDGSSDDTNAIANAFLVAAHGGPPVVLPAGRSFKITRYIRIYSDTVVQLLGKLQLTGRSSGLFADGASNIMILGCNVGTLHDATVASSYH